MNEMPGHSPVYTLDEALVATGFGKFQGLVLFYAGLGYVAEAMEMMILSFVGPAVRSEWGLSSSEESLITTVVFVGMLIGAYSWGLISDSYGRRVGLLSIAIVASGAGFLSCFSPNYISLIILRWLVGIGLGGGPIYTSWFLEFVPFPSRGTWMVIFSTFWSVGSILEASLAWIVMPRLGWRWLLALSSVPSFLALLFYSITPESPRYLCLKGRTTDAHNLLQKVERVNGTKLPPGLLVSDNTLKLDKEIAPSEDTPLLSSTTNKSMVSETGFSSFLMLFSSKLIRTTILLWVVVFGNAFSYYGIILLTSQLSNGQSRCSSVSISSKSSEDTNLYIDVFITSFAELPGLVLSAVIVDRIGRKLSMGFMLMLGCIFILPLVLHQHEILTIALLFGARMSINGAFTVAYIYAPEIYPTFMRTTGFGVASAVGRIGGMICPLVAVGLVAGCHQTAAIILFAAVIVLSAVCVMLLPFETKGCELTDTVSVSNSTGVTVVN